MAIALDLIIVIFIVVLAWWHRDPWQYAIAGLGFILFGLSLPGIIPNHLYYLSSLLVIEGVYSFFKAAWDRPRKK